jgi:hypothetical protein
MDSIDAMKKSLSENIARMQQPMKDFSALRMPEYRLPNLQIQPSPLVTAAQDNRASEFHKRLRKWIDDFDTTLDQAHEVGACLVSFGQRIVFRLNEMGYWNPSLMIFKGTAEDGNPVELIQHVSQISLLLMKLPRKDPSQPKRPIGFIVPDQSSEDETQPEV